MYYSGCFLVSSNKRKKNPPKNGLNNKEKHHLVKSVAELFQECIFPHLFALPSWLCQHCSQANIVPRWLPHSKSITCISKNSQLKKTALPLCLLSIRKIFREASCTPTHSPASLSLDHFELNRTLMLKPTAGKRMPYSNWLLHETTNNFCFQQQITFISYVNQFLLLCTKSPDKYICTTFSHAYNQR